jgi:hypothetical protein
MRLTVDSINASKTHFADAAPLAATVSGAKERDREGAEDCCDLRAGERQIGLSHAALLRRVGKPQLARGRRAKAGLACGRHALGPRCIDTGCQRRSPLAGSTVGLTHDIGQRPVRIRASS